MQLQVSQPEPSSAMNENEDGLTEQRKQSVAIKEEQKMRGNYLWACRWGQSVCCSGGSRNRHPSSVSSYWPCPERHLWIRLSQHSKRQRRLHCQSNFKNEKRANPNHHCEGWVSNKVGCWGRTSKQVGGRILKARSSITHLNRAATRLNWFKIRTRN